MAERSRRHGSGVTERPILVMCGPSSFSGKGLSGSSHDARQQTEDTPLIEAWEDGSKPALTPYGSVRE